MFNVKVKDMNLAAQIHMSGNIGTIKIQDLDTQYSKITIKYKDKRKSQKDSYEPRWLAHENYNKLLASGMFEEVKQNKIGETK